MRNKRRRAEPADLHMPTNEVVDCRRAAPVWHLFELDAGKPRKPFGNDVQLRGRHQVVSTDDRRRGGRRALAGWAEPAFQRSNQRSGRSSANDVPLGRGRVVDITQVADRLSERSRHWPRPSHTVDGRPGGRENSPSRPTIPGMTVVDRPTISEQFFGQFHAHRFPNRWKMPSIYIHFCTRPRRTRRSARPVVFLIRGERGLLPASLSRHGF